MNKVFKAGTMYIIVTFVSAIVSIVSTPIFTRMMNLNDYGTAVTYASWTAIFLSVANLNVRASILQSKHEFPSDNDKYISSILSLSTISITVFFAILFLICKYVYNILSLPLILIVIMYVECLCSNVFNIFQAKSRAYFEYKAYSIASIMLMILSPVCAIILLNFVTNDLYLYRIIGNLIPYFAFAIILYFLILKKGKCFINKKFWRFALTFSIPLMPHVLSAVILSQFDKVIINTINDSASVAVYGVAVSIVSIITKIYQSMNQAWSPWWYEQMHTNNFALIKKTTEQYSAVISFMYFSFLTVVPEALGFLTTPAYAEAKYLVPVLAMGSFSVFIYTFYVNIELYHKKTAQISLFTLIASIVNIITNFMFIPIFGYGAAAYTTLLSYLIMLFLHSCNARKIEKANIIPNSHFLKLLISMLSITLLMIYLYNHFFIRYTCFVIGCIVFALVFKDDVKEIYGIIKKKFQIY